MNTLSYFWNLENDPARADWLEGADRLIPPEEIERIVVEWPEGVQEIRREHLAGPVKLTLGWTAAVNIYCMFAFTVPVPEPLVDPRNFAFGDSFVFFTNTNEFLNRVRDALRATGKQHRFWLVDYVDLDPSEIKHGGFMKHRRFSYQSEFRIALYGGDAFPASTDEPYSLLVGSLEDVCTEVQPLERINELIRVR
jgi:hypothetical protein